MRNQNYGLPLVSKSPDNVQKETDFLRSQNSSRLIEDENFSLTIKHFQDFYTLLHGNAHIFNNILGIDFQSVFFRKRGNLCLRFL